MRKLSALTVFALSLTLYACGGTTAPTRTLTARQALTSSPELLDFETAASRQRMFAELSTSSQTEAGQRANSPVLFPMSKDGDLVAAPGFDVHTDLLQAPDAGLLQLSFDSLHGDRWSDERSDTLQGLSEREAAELVARSLLHLWDVKPSGAVQVDRATGAPYAAAYMDGVLRLNPAFVVLAASAQPSQN